MPTTSEEIRIGGIAIRFLVDGTASGGSVAIFELDVEPAARVPIAHSHDAYEETIYGLEGTLTLTLAGEPRPIGPGDAVLIPRGAVHHFANLHPPAPAPSASSPPASSAPPTSARSPTSSAPPPKPEPHPTQPTSPPSCAATASLPPLRKIGVKAPN